MRKSQSIAIGLLATSIASCSSPQHRHTVIGTGGNWDENDSTNSVVYVDDGYGYVPTYYHHHYYHPIYVNYYYGYYNGHISNSSGGRVGHVSSSHTANISRSGFGSLGHSASS